MLQKFDMHVFRETWGIQNYQQLFNKTFHGQGILKNGIENGSQHTRSQDVVTNREFL